MPEVVKSELINGRVSIILMINEANNKHYVHIQFLSNQAYFDNVNDNKSAHPSNHLNRK